MKVKTIVDEDFLNYKTPSMYIGTIYCDGKCCYEAGVPFSICHNDGWLKAATLDVADENIIQRYLDNPITHSICFGGLEPFEQFEEVYGFINTLRNVFNCTDTVVIYTGFEREEVEDKILMLKSLSNIVVKFGRFRPREQAKHYDEVLGVYLSSPNQHAEKIS